MSDIRTHFPHHFDLPPHIGWWSTNWGWRWWDGDMWSFRHNGSDILPNTLRDPIVRSWCHYWPEGARVPRVDPNDPKCKGIVAWILAAQRADGKDPAAAAWARRFAHKANDARLERMQRDEQPGSTQTVRKMKLLVRCPQCGHDTTYQEV